MSETFTADRLITVPVDCKLKLSVSYFRSDGSHITIFEGSSIKVDILKGIGCFQEDHFYIEETEYLVDAPH